MKFKQKHLKRKKNPPAADSFNYSSKYSKKHEPKPNWANGLHFVWGAKVLFGGGLTPPKPMPGYVPDASGLS